MKLNIDTFGDIMDEFLNKSHVQMLIDMPEGPQEVTIKDNCGLGPVVHFYIMMQGLSTTFHEFQDILEEEKLEDFIDSMLQMVKKEVLGEEESS